MKTYMIVMASLIIQVGCASSGGWRSADAIYQVPVKPELFQYATYPISDMRVRMVSDQRELKYTLPIELTGKPQVIHYVEGVANPGVTAECKDLQCQVKYSNLEFDEEGVVAFLKSKNLSEKEYTARIAVFHHFATDPEGIIEFQETRAFIPYQ